MILSSAALMKKNGLTPVSRRFGLYLLLMVLAIDGMAAWWAADSLQISRQEYESRAALLTQNTAKVIDQAIAASVEKVDLTLRFVIDDLESQLAQHGRLDSNHLRDLLERHQSRVPEIELIVVTDPSGQALRFHEGQERIINLSDRPHFQVHLASRDVGLFISPPVVGRMTKVWQINFTRRYNNPDGSFGGVVSAVVPLTHFSAVLAGPDLGPKGISLLRYSDGSMIVRQPPVTGPSGKVGAKGFSPEMAEAIASGERTVTFHSKLTSDRVERTDTLRRVQGTPFLLIIGVGTADYLEEWVAERNNILILGGAFCAVVALAGGLIWRLLARQFSTGLELAKSNTELFAALETLEQRNAEISRFTEVLSHHLQEPVRLQHAFAQRLQHLLPTPLSPELDRALGFIRNGALRQRALLRDVEHYLAITQASVPPQPCPAEEALAEACRRLQDKISATGAGIHSHGLPTVMIEPERLVELFAEIIDNALEYRREESPPEIRVTGRELNGEGLIAVADNGVGIPEQFRRRVFRVFERVGPRAEHDGTGIGLALAERIVQTAKGAIWIETSEMGGTKVVWTLPLAEN